MAFRKRRAQQRIERDPDSQKFRVIRDRINAKDFSGALEKINNRLAVVQAPLKRATLLALAGDCAFKRGAYVEAKQAYDSASALAAGHPRLWFRPLLASIRCDLKVGMTDAALQMARQAAAISEQKSAAFTAAAAAANAQLQATGQATVPVIPLRVPVVATKLGDTFFLEGEPDSAKEFYEKAIASNPNGSCKARIGLSNFALSYDQPEVAVQRATEALTIGAFRKKTIPAWKPLIAGLRRLGPVTISPQLLAGLSGAEPSVRARAILELTTQLRSSGSTQWKDIAASWLTNSAAAFPSVAAELRKNLLAEAKLTGVSSSTAASNFLATPSLSPQEWLSGAKVVAANAFKSDDTSFGVQSLIAGGMSLYGATYLCSFAHGIGLTARECGEVEIARSLFNQAASAAGSGNQAGWSKAIWALAELNDEAEDYTAAGQLWRQVTTNPSVPERFRLQAMLKWAVALQMGSPTGSLAEPKAAFLDAISSVAKSETVLDLARQMRESPVQWTQLEDELVARGETLALSEFQAAAHPSVAVAILRNLARRQYNDFLRPKKIVALWTSLTQKKRDWLWSDNAAFWEYLSYVACSLFDVKQKTKALEMSKRYLEDAATPAQGMAILGAPVYRYILFSGDKAEAFSGFEWLTGAAPRRPETGEAYYWLALMAAKKGDWASAFNSAKLSQTCSKASSGVSAQKVMDIKAALILRRLDTDALASEGIYSQEGLRHAAGVLKSDLTYV